MKQQLLVYSKKKQHTNSLQQIQNQNGGGLIDHIAIGSYYEIDHSKLPLKAPQQLKQVKLIMVSDKTGLGVAVRFPSIRSLRGYFGDYGKRFLLPALDEKHVMEAEVAAEALFRRVADEEMVDRRGCWDFWVVGGEIGGEELKMGSCWKEIEGGEMVRWAVRRKVRFLRPHEEGVVEEEEEEGGKRVEKTEGESEEEEVKVEAGLTRELRKRKTGFEDWQKGKELKVERVVVRRSCKTRKTVGKHINRWSAQRYKLAEENILKVLKEKNAVFGNPISRPALRSEARKLIGDTGLLDHLLKQMAGKVAPGGNERFMRRHNADGAMEYWLESADLMNIRKEAGVRDPYWIPPPGWKPGDCPFQDPIIAKEIKHLKEEVHNLMGLKEEMHKMMGLKEEMTKMKEEMKKLVAEKQSQDVTVVTTQSSSATSMHIEQADALVPLKGKYLELQELHKKKAKIEEKLTLLSKLLSQMEERMVKLIWNVEDKNTPEPASPLPMLQLSFTSGGDHQTNAVLSLTESQEDILKQATAKEEKAAKIERLKSGFKICKPQGTFLWPNMTTSPLAIPTPPSASSSTSLPRLIQNAGRLPSHVDPLAEKQVFPVTPAQPENVTFINIKTPSLNLNESPCIFNNDGY